MSTYNKKLPNKTIWVALLTVFVIVSSLCLVVVFSENKIIHLILGSGRIFIFWLVLYALVYFGERILKNKKGAE